MSETVAESPAPLVNAAYGCEGVTRGNVYLVDPRQLKVDWTKNISRGCKEPEVDDSLIALAKDMISSGVSGETGEGSSGQLNPILVRIKGKGEPFEVVGGFRRLRAALWLIESGTCTDFKIKYSISRMSEAEAAVINTVENLHRENPKPIEIAYAIRSLNEGYGMKMKTIADRLKKSVAWCESMLELLSLPAPIREKVATGKIKPGAAMELAKLPADQQAATMEELSKDGGKVTPAKVKAARQAIREETGEGAPVKKTIKQIKEYLAEFSFPNTNGELACKMLIDWIDGNISDRAMDDVLVKAFGGIEAGE